MVGFPCSKVKLTCSLDRHFNSWSVGISCKHFEWCSLICNNITQIINSQRRHDRLNCVVSDGSADGLAPNGARPSAGTVVTRCSSCIDIWPALAGFKNGYCQWMRPIRPSIQCKRRLLKWFNQYWVLFKIELMSGAVIKWMGRINTRACWRKIGLFASGKASGT